MAEYKKIVILDDEVEASLMEDILKDRGIPFKMRSYEDLAFDGVYQLYRGWGHIESTEEYREVIVEIYQDINQTED